MPMKLITQSCRVAMIDMLRSHVWIRVGGFLSGTEVLEIEEDKLKDRSHRYIFNIIGITELHDPAIVKFHGRHIIESSCKGFAAMWESLENWNLCNGAPFWDHFMMNSLCS